MPRTVRRLYVPIDDSGYSFAAIDLAVDLAGRLDAMLIGSHVNASGSPGSYLDLLEECCRTAGVPFQKQTLEGHRHRALVDDLRQNPCDLVVMGALGADATSDSQIGSIAEALARSSPADVLIVKSLLPEEEGGILVALDGSPPSLDALVTALHLSRVTGRTASAIVVGEGPIAGAASVAVEAARSTAAAEGFDIEVSVAEGRAFDRILQACREKRPWLLALGRTGTDSRDEDRLATLGPTTMNLLRLATCNILVAPGLRPAVTKGQPVAPPTAAVVAAPAKRTLRWTSDAERLLEDVPPEQRSEMIRTVEEGARKIGTALITAKTIDRVMQGYIDS